MQAPCCQPDPHTITIALSVGIRKVCCPDGYKTAAQLGYPSMAFEEQGLTLTWSI